MLELTLRNTLVLLLCLCIAGCAVTRRQEFSPEVAVQRIQPGSEVIIALHSGRKYSAVVRSIDETELVTERSRYAMKDIRYVALEKFDPGATIAASAAGVVLLSALAAVLFGLMLEQALED